jgi:hypothetical protein
VANKPEGKLRVYWRQTNEAANVPAYGFLFRIIVWVSEWLMFPTVAMFGPRKPPQADEKYFFQRAIKIDLYLLCRVGLGLGLVFWSSSDPGLRVVFLIVSGYMLATLLAASIHYGLVSNPDREDSLDMALSLQRSAGLAFLNYVEVIVWFAVVFSSLHEPFLPVPADGSTVANLGGWDAIYFSSITAFTIGYGDFAPQTSLARMLVACESVFSLTILTLTIGRVMSSMKSLVDWNHTKYRRKQEDPIE